ncbi:hypothetical protein MCOR02_012432 [Pyricularia oryzae]|nr:hypothetical protein MCOR02_012432 [Pyricularia oryzae]
MYGANSLVWQGVQNATIGTIYTTRYGFSTAGVAAAYAGGVLGSVIGGLYRQGGPDADAGHHLRAHPQHLSFAINYGSPLVNHNGYLAVYCIVGAIGLLWNASCFVMIRYGRRIREWTAPRYYRDVQRARAKGLGH